MGEERCFLEDHADASFFWWHGDDVFFIDDLREEGDGAGRDGFESCDTS